RLRRIVHTVLHRLGWNPRSLRLSPPATLCLCSAPGGGAPLRPGKRARGAVVPGKSGRAEFLQIRIVTYNIHRAIGVDRRFRPERVVAVLHHYDPDVVLLQEVDDGAPRSRELD